MVHGSYNLYNRYRDAGRTNLNGEKGSSPMTFNRLDLSNQHIFISGAGGAIGSAAARACAMLGATLTLSDLSSPEEIAQELRANGCTARPLALDNCDRHEVTRQVNGLLPLDALIDCSGFYRQGEWNADDDSWDDLLAQTLTVNVRGPVNLVRAVLPGMIARRSGRIVLIGSLAARTGGTSLTVEPAYAASKGALHTLVRYFARQVAAHGVVVNAVAPGPILTPMLRAAHKSLSAAEYPMERLGEPEEIGWPAAFLASRAATFMTGTVIDANGGIAFS